MVQEFPRILHLTIIHYLVFIYPCFPRPRTRDQRPLPPHFPLVFGRALREGFKRWQVVGWIAVSWKAQGDKSVIAAIENPQFVDSFSQGLAGAIQTGGRHVIDFNDYHAHP